MKKAILILLVGCSNVMAASGRRFQMGAAKPDAPEILDYGEGLEMAIQRPKGISAGVLYKAGVRLIKKHHPSASTRKQLYSKMAELAYVTGEIPVRVLLFQILLAVSKETQGRSGLVSHLKQEKDLGLLSVLRRLKCLSLEEENWLEQELETQIHKNGGDALLGSIAGGFAIWGFRRQKGAANSGGGTAEEALQFVRNHTLLVELLGRTKDPWVYVVLIKELSDYNPQFMTPPFFVNGSEIELTHLAALLTARVLIEHFNFPQTLNEGHLLATVLHPVKPAHLVLPHPATWVPQLSYPALLPLFAVKRSLEDPFAQELKVAMDARFGELKPEETESIPPDAPQAVRLDLYLRERDRLNEACNNLWSDIGGEVRSSVAASDRKF